jgi:hypothetical protein
VSRSSASTLRGVGYRSRRASRFSVLIVRWARRKADRERLRADLQTLVPQARLEPATRDPVVRGPLPRSAQRALYQQTRPAIEPYQTIDGQHSPGLMWQLMLPSVAYVDHERRQVCPHRHRRVPNGIGSKRPRRASRRLAGPLRGSPPQPREAAPDYSGPPDQKTGGWASSGWGRCYFVFARAQNSELRRCFVRLWHARIVTVVLRPVSLVPPLTFSIWSAGTGAIPV